MRTDRLFRHALGAGALAAATLMLGCIESNDEVVSPGPRGNGDPKAITTEIHVTPTQFQSGQTIQIVVTSRNPTQLPITLHFASGCLEGFTVTNDKGVAVAPFGIVCTMDAPTVTLGAGESIDRTFQWDGRSSFGTGPVLPAGDYQITGSLNAAESHDPSSPVAVRLLH